MKAMILAAGRGERMRPLTDTIPKPLLRVGGKALIVWQIERLVAGGFNDLVINLAWLGEQIEAELGDGSSLGVRIRYSYEQEALETLGGVVLALPLLNPGNGKKAFEPFAVVSADIYTEYDYGRLADQVRSIASAYPRHAAHFVLTDNPPFHPAGDMALVNGRIARNGKRLNYGNIGIFHPALFEGLKRGEKLKLFPWAYQFLEGDRISGEHFRGIWENVGTIEQLTDLDHRLSR